MPSNKKTAGRDPGLDRWVEENALLTPERLADHLCVTVETLANWRCAGKGPPYHKIEGTVRYSRSDVAEYKATNRWLNTSAKVADGGSNDGEGQ